MLKESEKKLIADVLDDLKIFERTTRKKTFSLLKIIERLSAEYLNLDPTLAGPTYKEGEQHG